MKSIKDLLAESLLDKRDKYLSSLSKKILSSYMIYHRINLKSNIFLSIIDVVHIKKLLKFFPECDSKEAIFDQLITRTDKTIWKFERLIKKQKNKTKNKKNVILTNSSDIVKFFSRKKYNIKSFYKYLPRLLSSNNYLSPNGPKVFFIKDERFIINRVSNPQDYMDNYLKLRKLLRCSNKFLLPKDVAIVRLNNYDGYLITSWEGRTVEDEMRDEKKHDIESSLLLIVNLRKLMNDCGIFWYSFAPRNMVIKEGRLIIIDFEKTFNCDEISEEKKHYYEMFINIWFADVFKNTGIFSKANQRFSYSKCTADDFEKAWFDNRFISRKKRESLMNLSIRIEKCHVKNGDKVYGHSAGQYLSDFHRLKNEIIFYKAIQKNNRNNDFYLMWFIEQCILVDYYITMINNKSNIHDLMILNKVFANKRLLGSSELMKLIRYLYDEVSAKDFDIYQNRGLLLSIIEAWIQLDKNNLSIEKCKKILSVKINSVDFNRSIIVDYLNSKKQISSEVKNYYKNIVKNILKIIGRREGVSVALSGSFAHNNMNILSDLDGYYLCKNNNAKSRKLVSHYKSALRVFGIFLNENLLPIINQYLRYDTLMRVADEQGVKIGYEAHDWTEETEIKTITILGKANQILRSPALFIRFQKLLIIDFIRSEKYSDSLLPIYEIDGYPFEFVYGDFKLFDNFNKKIHKNFCLYGEKLKNSSCAKQDIINAEKDIANKSIIPIKKMNLPMYKCLYSLYWAKKISSPGVEKNIKIRKYSDLINYLVVKNAFLNDEYLFYLYFFSRKLQIKIKTIKMQKRIYDKNLIQVFGDMKKTCVQ